MRKSLWTAKDEARSVAAINEIIDETIHTEVSDRDRIDRLEKEVAEVKAHCRETDALIDRLIALVEKQEADR